MENLIQNHGGHKGASVVLFILAMLLLLDGIKVLSEYPIVTLPNPQDCENVGPLASNTSYTSYHLLLTPRTLRHTANLANPYPYLCLEPPLPCLLYHNYLQLRVLHKSGLILHAPGFRTVKLQVFVIITKKHHPKQESSLYCTKCHSLNHT